MKAALNLGHQGVTPYCPKMLAPVVLDARNRRRTIAVVLPCFRPTQTREAGGFVDNHNQIKARVSSVIDGANCYPFLFLGSGISRRYMGTRSWEGLLRWICTEVLSDEFAYVRALNEATNATKNGLTDSPMPYVATLLEKEVDQILLRNARFGWFRRRYDRELKAGVSPTKQFIADDLSKATISDCEEVRLLTGPCAKKLSGIITTNYDHLAEGLFPQSEVFVGGNDLLFREMSYADEIYKIHGSASSPNSMVLDKADYDGFRDRQAYIAAKILTLFVEYPIIFLGYSLKDPNMSSILEAIARCAGEEGAAALANRFVFVEYGDPENDAVQVVERIFGNESIRMTRVVTRDFLPVYEAIAEAEERYDPRTVRMLRRSIYAIASHLDPSSTVVTSGFSKLENLSDDDRVIIGFNAVGEGFGKIPTAEDLYYDVVFSDDDFNPSLVVSDYLPKLLRSNPGGLPMHKYLHDADATELSERVADQLATKTSMDSFLNDGIRRTSSGWRGLLSEYSIAGLVATFGFDAAHTRLAALEPSEIDVEQLNVHLKQVISRGGGRAALRNNSELKRAIRIYDFLRYARKE